MTATEFLGALRTSKLVGRKRELAALRSAIDAQGTSRYLYFVGEGGMGKTRLLEEVPIILRDCTNRDTYQLGQILDFYHVDFHSGSSIERTIMSELDPDKSHFRTYRQTRVQYETLLKEGAASQQLVCLRAQLRNCFVADFNAFCQIRRPILRFDTLELLQYENDPIQQEFRRELQDAQKRGLLGAARGWLVDVLPQLNNVVVILSGRPSAKELVTDLQDVLDQALTIYKLDPLNQTETLTYIDALSDTPQGDDTTVTDVIRGIKDEVSKYIYRITNGEPLLVSMVINMLYSGTILPAHLEKMAYSEMEAKIVEWIQQYELSKNLPLSYINLLRKGVDAPRLHTVTKWKVSRCLQELETLRPFVYIKIRRIDPNHTEQDLFFLHDKMYEWIEKIAYVGSDQVCSTIIDYYAKQIEQQPKQADVFRTEQLYYKLLRAPSTGFAQYIQLSDDALSRQLIEYEMSLRDEMLRFYRGHLPEYAKRDLVVRWMKRFIFLSKYRIAFEMGENPVAIRLLQGCRDPAQTTDAYLTIDFLVTRAQAAAYWGRYIDQAKDFLSQAIGLAASLAPKQNTANYQRLAFLLGRAFKLEGYLAAREKRFDDAVHDYTEAIEYFRNAKVETEQAYTLNNRGFAYASLGDDEQAQNDSSQAYRLFRGLGMKVGQALALNTMALIQLSQGQDPGQAELWCRTALSLSLELHDERTEGLISIALAWALRKRGALAKLGLPEEEKFFEEAKICAEQAVNIFEKNVPELARQIEAYSQLGRVYRDWALFYRELDLGIKDAEEKEQLAEQNLRRSSDLAKENKLTRERADALEDIAEIYLNRGGYDEAFSLLDECERVIPEEYKITRKQGVPDRDNPDLHDTDLWQMLGKIEILRSRIYFAQGEPNDAIEHTFLTYAYFDLYTAYTIKPIVHQAMTNRIEKDLRAWSCDVLSRVYAYSSQVLTTYQLQNSRGAELLLYIVKKVFKAKCPSDAQGGSQ